MGKTNVPPYAGDYQVTSRLRADNTLESGADTRGSSGGSAAWSRLTVAARVWLDIGGSIRFRPPGAASTATAQHRHHPGQRPFPGSPLPNPPSI